MPQQYSKFWSMMFQTSLFLLTWMICSPFPEVWRKVLSLSNGPVEILREQAAHESWDVSSILKLKLFRLYRWEYADKCRPKDEKGRGCVACTYPVETTIQLFEVWHSRAVKMVLEEWWGWLGAFFFRIMTWSILHPDNQFSSFGYINWATAHTNVCFWLPARLCVCPAGSFICFHSCEHHSAFVVEMVNNPFAVKIDLT